MADTSRLELMDFDASTNSEHPLLTCMISNNEDTHFNYVNAITNSGFIADLVNHFKQELNEV